MSAVTGQDTESGDLEYWKGKWDRDDIGWHKDHVSPFLIKHSDEFLAGESGLKIFVPLCGKTMDMVWLAERGHMIIGVEVAEKAVIDFFTENNIPYTKHDVPSIPSALLYKSSDDHIRLYVCDLFDFNVHIEGQFQRIFDRGSLVAISKDDHTRYRELMGSLMVPECRYILECFQYDDTSFCNCPHSIPLKGLEDLFQCQNGGLSMKYLSEQTTPAPRPEMVEVGITHIRRYIVLISDGAHCTTR